MSKSLKMLLGALAVSSLALVGCMNDSSTAPSSTTEGRQDIGLSVRTSAVNALSKSRLAKGGRYDSLMIDSMFVKLTSQGAATSTETITIWFKPGSGKPSSYLATAGNDSATVVRDTLSTSLDSNAYAGQTLNGLALNLKTLRDWKVEVGTLRGTDTLQFGSDTVIKLYAGQKQTATVPVEPLFTSYQANFNFPEVIKSSTSSDSQIVQITRVKFLLDSANIKIDPALDSAAIFAPSVAHAVVYSAKTVSFTGYDSVIVQVYGKLPQAVNDTLDTNWSNEQVLYSKKVLIASLSSTVPTTVALDWKGPVRGVSSIAITIGKVNLYIMNATTGGVVLDKRSK